MTSETKECIIGRPCHDEVSIQFPEGRTVEQIEDMFGYVAVQYTGQDYPTIQALFSERRTYFKDCGNERSAVTSSGQVVRAKAALRNQNIELRFVPKGPVLEYTGIEARIEPRNEREPLTQSQLEERRQSEERAITQLVDIIQRYFMTQR